MIGHSQYIIMKFFSIAAGIYCHPDKLCRVLTAKLNLMTRLRLTVLTTRNETWCLWKRLYKFWNSNFMPAILSRLSILFINYISLYL